MWVVSHHSLTLRDSVCMCVASVRALFGWLLLWKECKCTDVSKLLMPPCNRCQSLWQVVMTTSKLVMVMWWCCLISVSDKVKWFRLHSCRLHKKDRWKELVTSSSEQFNNCIAIVYDDAAQVWGFGVVGGQSGIYGEHDTSHYWPARDVPLLHYHPWHVSWKIFLLHTLPL